jgi:hypothetical protein
VVAPPLKLFPAVIYAGGFANIGGDLDRPLKLYLELFIITFHPPRRDKVKCK